MKNKKMYAVLFFLVVFGILHAEKKTWKFEFGHTNIQKGFVGVDASTTYTDQLGYGFDLGTHPQDFSFQGTPFHGDGVKDTTSFFFSVALPQGNYTVKIWFAGMENSSNTTVKAESRRLIFLNVKTPAEALLTKTLSVNIRNSKISNTLSVKLKPREIGKLDWDNKLTLEFGGKHPAIVAIEIIRNGQIPTAFIFGDSTVTDQQMEPWTGWGQMLPFFFNQGIAFANYAASGEAGNTFIAARRLDKALTQMKKGDYVFIQFGHNDQKQHFPGSGAFGSYKKSLIEIIMAVRKKGATPILVTPMNRRFFDSKGKVINTLGEFPEAVRITAKEEHVPLIDLNAMSKILYEAWGPDGSTKAFVHYSAGTFPGQTVALADNSHFNEYGAYELAKCIIKGCIQQKLGLMKFLRHNYKPFNPAQPDSWHTFVVPMSPFITLIKPLGS